jgi:hypothetical protein
MPLAVETYGYMGADFISFLRRLADAAAVQHAASIITAPV